MPYFKNTNPSNFERRIEALLASLDLIYVTEFSFSDLNSANGLPLRFDFAVFEDLSALEGEQPKFLIEANGEQHYRQKFTSAKAFERQKANDRRKIKYCEVKKIPLVVIPYLEAMSITGEQILERGNYFN